MKKPYVKILFVFICILLNACGVKENDYLKNFPQESDPHIIGERLVKRFLERPHSTFGAFKEKAPKFITYPDVCTWLGAFWYAEEVGDTILKDKLIERFNPLMNVDSIMQPVPNHVDNTVFGALPLEVYFQTGDKSAKDLGLYYADSQWNLPERWTLEGQPQRSCKEYGILSDAHIFQPEQKYWYDRGYSWQTRLWLDDMFMITTVQAQAYRATSDMKYMDRAAKEMILYIDSIQLDNGLFNHGPNVEFRWARGNGWMAFGLTELLRILPEDHVARKRIMDSYLTMMNTLLKCQAENGMWRQLVDEEDTWYETSGSAMFAYAFIVGVKNGWLNYETFAPAARKAWIALTDYVNADGDVTDVCVGTNIGDSKQYYMERERLIGDLHGQAPVLWCAVALLN